MARYIISSQAEQDIYEILSHIAKDNIDAALDLNGRLIEIFKMLANNQEAGRERPELIEGLRSLPDGNYVIFYRQWAGNIAIVRILHSALDLDELFS